MKTEESNRLIAEFMANDAVNSPHLKEDWELEYDCSWGSLMPVVGKIESIEGVIFDIHSEASKVKVYISDIQDWVTTQWDAVDKINHVYKACIQFILYHNSTTPQTK